MVSAQRRRPHSRLAPWPRSPASQLPARQREGAELSKRSERQGRGERGGQGRGKDGERKVSGRPRLGPTPSSQDGALLFDALAVPSGAQTPPQSRCARPDLFGCRRYRDRFGCRNRRLRLPASPSLSLAGSPPGRPRERRHKEEDLLALSLAKESKFLGLMDTKGVSQAENKGSKSRVHFQAENKASQGKVGERNWEQFPEDPGGNRLSGPISVKFQTMKLSHFYDGSVKTNTQNLKSHPHWDLLYHRWEVILQDRSLHGESPPLCH
ncbi:uncharacterized protein LOC112541267 [Python bivittatus]|uniref:Uncharacterized protein LOC112541267 n=1 Tax=Python bivittatus TaxID=176946 RepID=A0A9F5IJ25_PYTBI|nr:uncharacterized protein LOC112541267 [Python bivittatus]